MQIIPKHPIYISVWPSIGRAFLRFNECHLVKFLADLIDLPSRHENPIDPRIALNSRANFSRDTQSWKPQLLTATFEAVPSAVVVTVMAVAVALAGIGGLNVTVN